MDEGWVRVKVRHVVVRIKVGGRGLGMHYVNDGPHQDSDTRLCVGV